MSRASCTGLYGNSRAVGGMWRQGRQPASDLQHGMMPQDGVWDGILQYRIPIEVINELHHCDSQSQPRSDILHAKVDRTVVHSISKTSVGDDRRLVP